MNILIIDNGTNYIEKLKTLVGGDACQIIAYSEIDLSNINEFSAIILSGGHNFSVAGNMDKFEKEIEIVKRFNGPIFGICFGFELISSIFGAKLARLEKKERGIIDIEVVCHDPIFQNISDFKVFESHRWVVKESPNELTALAKSKDGIEAVKHKKRPIYGVQFHPEIFIDTTCGDEIFYNFISLVKNNFYN